jgi:glutamate synthase domain-containing protein 1
MYSFGAPLVILMLSAGIDAGCACIVAAPPQVFVANNKNHSPKDFEREMFRSRKLIEAEAELSPHLKDMYICSLSNQTITYKGQLTPEQLYGYYGDLQHEDFVSHMALVHSRFSTNTFPSWDRAQPVRMMCHNGEINTLRGNKNMAMARSGLMESAYFKDDTAQLLPIVSDKMSDSGNFDSCLETLVKGSERSLPETVMMMVPEAWQDNQYLSATKQVRRSPGAVPLPCSLAAVSTESKVGWRLCLTNHPLGPPSLPLHSPPLQAFYEYNSCVMEPWDGPAMIAFTDGRYIGATLDRNGLRPSRYYVTHDDRVLLSSEVGVLSQLPDAVVKTKARLEPGKMFLVDFDKGEIVPDTVIKEEVAVKHPYGSWISQRLMRLEEWQGAAAKAQIRLPTYNLAESNRKFNLFGYTTETMDMLLYPMAVGGKEPLGSMGNDAPLAVISTQPRQMSDYFKQLFAQVRAVP